MFSRCKVEMAAGAQGVQATARWAAQRYSKARWVPLHHPWAGTRASQPASSPPPPTPSLHAPPSPHPPPAPARGSVRGRVAMAMACQSWPLMPGSHAARAATGCLGRIAAAHCCSGLRRPSLPPLGAARHWLLPWLLAVYKKTMFLHVFLDS